MRILFLSAWFPFPPTNGSELRIASLLRHLSTRHEVHLLSFSREPDETAQSPEAQRLCASTQVIPWRPYRPRSLRALAGAFDPRPRSVVDTWSRPMEAAIGRTLEGRPFDVIVASQTTMAAYAAGLTAAPAILEEVELGALAPIRRADRSELARYRQRLTWWKHRRFVTDLLAGFRACTVVSEPERDLLREIAPAYTPVFLVPNGVDVDAADASREEPAPDTLIFTGSLTYGPNREGLEWFLSRVLPRIRSRRPGVRVVVTGHSGGVHFDMPEVSQTGLLADLRPVLRRATLSIVPVLSGGGTRLKALEAMARGVAVISTSKGAEGLDVVSGEHLLIANHPRDFAEAVLHLLAEPERRRRIEAGGHRFVATRHGHAHAGEAFDAVLAFATGRKPGIVE